MSLLRTTIDPAISWRILRPPDGVYSSVFLVDSQVHITAKRPIQELSAAGTADRDRKQLKFKTIRGIARQNDMPPADGSSAGHIDDAAT